MCRGRGARWLGSAALMAAGGGVPYGTLFVIDGAKIVQVFDICKNVLSPQSSVNMRAADRGKNVHVKKLLFLYRIYVVYSILK